jgi:hypothetical protein
MGDYQALQATLQPMPLEKLVSQPLMKLVAIPSIIHHKHILDLQVSQ